MKVKGTKLIIIVICLLVIVGGLMVLGGFSSSGQKPGFKAGGYLLQARTEDEVIQLVTTEFSADTNYKRSATGTMTFNGIGGEAVSCEANSFLHYADGSVASFVDGVLVNTTTLQSGELTYYMLPAETVLARTGPGYETDNNGNAMQFENFIYKIGEVKYMLVSPSLTLHLPDGSSQQIKDYMEVTYLEEGIVQILAQEGAWLLLTDGTSVDFGNGVSVDLDSGEVLRPNGTAALGLDNILLTATAVTIENSDEWVPPTFNITTIDGVDGDLGEDGDEGQDGDEGDQGEDGVVGAAGSVGASGMNGPSGSSTGATAVTMATMSLTSFQPTAGSVSFNVQVDKGDWDLMDPAQRNTLGTVELWNMNTGMLSDTVACDFNVDNDSGVFGPFSFDGLSADVPYRIIVNSPYSYTYSDGVNDISPHGTKCFIDRTFTTDSTGVYLNNARGTSTSSVGAEVSVRPWAFSSDVNWLCIALRDAQGDLVAEVPPQVYEIDAGALRGDPNWTLDAATGDYTMDWVGDRLKSNSSYNISIYTSANVVQPAVGQNDLDSTNWWRRDSEDVLTLKAMPTIGNVQADVYNGQAAIYIDSVSDATLISSWTYNIYEQGKESTPVLSFTRKDNGGIFLPVDGTTIQYGIPYVVRASVTVHDNEKEVVLPAANNTVGASFLCYSGGGSHITFQNANNIDVDGDNVGDLGYTFNSVTGTLTLRTGDVPVLIGKNSETGDAHVVRYELLDHSGAVVLSGELEPKHDAWPGVTILGSNTTLSTTVHFKPAEGILESDVPYTLRVYGDHFDKASQSVTNTTDLNSYAGAAMLRDQLLGSYTFTLPTAEPVFIHLTPSEKNEATSSRLPFTLKLPKLEDIFDTNVEGENYPWESTSEQLINDLRNPASERYMRYLYSLQQLHAIKMELYASNRPDPAYKVGTPYVITRDMLSGDSTFYDLYLNGGELSLNETLFGINSDSVTGGAYYVQVTAMYDISYDETGNFGFTNEIPSQMRSLIEIDPSMGTSYLQVVSPSGAELSPQSTLPVLPETEQGVTVTYICNADAELLGMPMDPALNEDTIVGYLLQASYASNLLGPLKSVTYYGFHAQDVETYYSSTNDLTRQKDLISAYEEMSNGSNLLGLTKSTDPMADSLAFKITVPILPTDTYSARPTSKIPSVVVFFGDRASEMTQGLTQMFPGGEGGVSLTSTQTDDFTEAEKTLRNSYGSGLTMARIFGADYANMSDADFKHVPKDSEDRYLMYYTYVADEENVRAFTSSANLTRGNHYSFAYTAEYELTSTNKGTYPQDSGYALATDHKNFLSSAPIAAWRQPATANSHLYTTGGGVEYLAPDLTFILPEQYEGVPDRTLSTLASPTSITGGGVGADGVIRPGWYTPLANPTMPGTYTSGMLLWDFDILDPDACIDPNTLQTSVTAGSTVGAADYWGTQITEVTSIDILGSSIPGHTLKGSSVFQLDTGTPFSAVNLFANQEMFNTGANKHEYVADGVATPEYWYPGEPYADGSQQVEETRVTTLHLIGLPNQAAVFSQPVSVPGVTYGADGTPTSASSLEWKTSAVENIVTFSISANDAGSDYAAIRNFLTNNVAFIQVTARFAESAKTDTAYFTTYKSAMLTEGESNISAINISAQEITFRWNMTTLQGLTASDKLQFSFDYYYRSGYATQDPSLLRADADRNNTSQVPMLYSEDGVRKTGEYFSAPYLLYGVQSNGQSAYMNIFNASSRTDMALSTNPGSMIFYNVNPNQGGSLSFETNYGIAIRLTEQANIYLGPDALWTHPNIGDEQTATLRVVRAQNGMGVGLNMSDPFPIAFDRVALFTDSYLTAPLLAQDVIGALTHDFNNSDRGINYLSYAVVTSTQSLIPHQTVYVRLTDNVPAGVDLSSLTISVAEGDNDRLVIYDPNDPATAGNLVDIGGEKYFKWTLSSSTLTYELRFDGLEKNKTYYLEAFSAEKAPGETLVKADLTALKDGSGDAAAGNGGSAPSVQNKNLNFELITRSGVTLTNVSATFRQSKYNAKGLDIYFNTNVAEGYVLEARIYRGNQADFTDLINTVQSTAPGSAEHNEALTALDSMLEFDYQTLLDQYTTTNNRKFWSYDVVHTKDHDTENMLAESFFLVGETTATRNRLWIPLPPDKHVALGGVDDNGKNTPYFVVLRAVPDTVLTETPADPESFNQVPKYTVDAAMLEEESNTLNAPGVVAGVEKPVTGFEFVRGPISASATKMYIEMISANAGIRDVELEDGTMGTESIFTITSNLSDARRQIVNDGYNLLLQVEEPVEGGKVTLTEATTYFDGQTIEAGYELDLTVYDQLTVLDFEKLYHTDGSVMVDVETGAILHDYSKPHLYWTSSTNDTVQPIRAMDISISTVVRTFDGTEYVSYWTEDGLLSTNSNQVTTVAGLDAYGSRFYFSMVFQADTTNHLSHLTWNPTGGADGSGDWEPTYTTATTALVPVYNPDVVDATTSSVYALNQGGRYTVVVELSGGANLNKLDYVDYTAAHKQGGWMISGTARVVGTATSETITLELQLPTAAEIDPTTGQIPPATGHDLVVTLSPHAIDGCRISTKFPLTYSYRLVN